MEQYLRVNFDWLKVQKANGLDFILHMVVSLNYCLCTFLFTYLKKFVNITLEIHMKSTITFSKKTHL